MPRCIVFAVGEGRTRIVNAFSTQKTTHFRREIPRFAETAGTHGALKAGSAAPAQLQSLFASQERLSKPTRSGLVKTGLQVNMTQSAFSSLDSASGEPPSAGHDEPGPLGFMARNMQLDIKHCSPGKQCFSVVTRDFGPVSVARVHGTRSSFIRTSRHLADGRDLISVVISSSGRFLVDGVQGQNRFGPNGAAILESRREGALHKLDDNRGAWSICMERAPLEPLIAGVSDPVQRCVQADDSGLRLLDSYLGALFAMGDAHDPALATLHIRDLVLSTLGVRGEVQALVRERGVHAARQSVVLDTIRRRAGEQSLDPASVAKQSGISVRYLHQLLEPTGRTFSQHLLEQRLERARLELRKPDQRRNIADIALDCGFSDISHFNRSFRRVFGDTPNGVRVRAARESRAQESITRFVPAGKLR